MAEPLVAGGANPFTLLSLIAAPAVLTNAASLLVLSTSNRFARAIDRGRSLAAQLRNPQATDDPQSVLRLTQLRRAEQRSLLLLASLRLFYLAIGCFAAASLVSLFGAGLVSTEHDVVVQVSIVLSLLAGILGVGSLVYGCAILVRETRLAVVSISEDTRSLSERHSIPDAPPGEPV